MARLPSDGYLMQQIGGEAVLFQDYTEREIVRFDPADAAAAAQALEKIRASEDLGDEDKSFGCFWAGYFASLAGHPEPGPDFPLVAVARDGSVQVLQHGWCEIVKYDPRDRNATAMAQFAIHQSGLDQADKDQAHFWCGYFWGRHDGDALRPPSPVEPEPAEPEPTRRPYYADLGVTDDQAARGDDFGCYDFPNLGGLGRKNAEERDW